MATTGIKRINVKKTIDKGGTRQRGSDQATTLGQGKGGRSVLG